MESSIKLKKREPENMDLANMHKTLDTNSHFIAKLMFRRGIDLQRVVVIPDEEDAIVSTVQELSEMVGPSGYVFTTGGIGPTHDDITYESVAKAFGRGVEFHKPTLEGLEAAMKNRPGGMTEGRKRMALLPVGCKTLTTEFWTPIAVVENVYILPGIPSMVRSMLTYNEEHFVGVPIYRALVNTLMLEGDLAAQLTAVQNAHPNIAIGSYVNLTKDETGVRDTSFNTRLTIEGRDENEVKEVSDDIAELFNGHQVESSSV
ncbi:FAD1 flavin adenine dinucleotide synthetase [Phytophthora boehmeriae]|uniref:FAD1 flavin adenine dinucleotide synthetase n=1 Tax=Phytophthora boehmeriae TaxID=109152 RepID=A0A8T1W2Q9_9STRA|nr:FAD1 flavin adenine dinucleotide synthetase [Phytophthora boehmeriae]